MKEDMDDFNRWLDEQNQSSAADPSSESVPVRDAPKETATNAESLQKKCILVDHK